MAASKPKLDFFRKNWLVLLIAAQPMLDILAYWTKNPNGTAAGYIRLAVMIVIPTYLLFTLKEKKRFVISMGIIGAFCVLHVLNCFRVGYINAVFDISYIARTVQIPVLGICFSYLIKNEETKEQAIKGLVSAAVILMLSILLAIITGTDNNTYGVGFGVSGWVTDDNRCANSIILVTAAVTAIYFAVKSDNKFIECLVPPFIAFMLILNGTKACYFSIFAVDIGFAAYIIISRFINGKQINKTAVAILLLTAVVSAAVYPITPRCKVSQSIAKGVNHHKNELEMMLDNLGYDLKSMTDEEKLADPVLVQTMGDYYYDIIWPVIHDMFDSFSYEEVLTQYKWSTDVAKIIDTRVMKKSYAALIWKDKDALTKLVGFEVSEPWFRAGSELENDWPALFYYYGYLGCALYVGFILYYVLRILRALLREFKNTVTLENFYLLMVFALHMGLAEFSGAVLRRPNVSIYTALILGVIFYKTAYNKKAGLKEAQR